MNYFYDIEFQKGVITVLGVEKNSCFVSALVKCLENKAFLFLKTPKKIILYAIIMMLVT